MGINYAEINSRAVNAFLSIGKHTTSISDHLKALVELRVSQLNGCSYCVDLHTQQARALGETQQRLDCMTVWRESLLFSDTEMAALAWAESVTHISSEPDIEGKLATLLKFYNETEAVDLTITIALMNSMNRMAISFGDKPEKRDS